MYNFDEIIDRRNTECIKYDGMKNVCPSAADDCIPMWIADMDFKCPPEVLAAMGKVLEHGIIGYSEIYSDEYYSSVINWMKKRFGADIKKENIAVSNGVVTAINNLVKLMSGADDNVVITTPSYAPFYRAVNGIDQRTCVFSKLKYENGKYEMDWEDFEKKISDEKTSLFILCNPHNPTGIVWSEEELTKMYTICKNANVKIISDEIHADLTRSGVNTVSMAKLYSNDNDVVVCTAPSKTFNVAGNHHSNIIIFDEKLCEEFKNVSNASISPFAVTATISAYNECENWLDELRLYIDKNFEFMDKFIKEKLPKAHFTIPDATYLAWINLSEYGYSNEEIEKYLAERGVLIEGGHNFVDNAEGWIRLNMACPMSVLKKALERIASALES